MIKNKRYENINQVVGPVDRLTRGAIAFIILVVSFTLPFTILEFAQMCGVTIYFFFTALTRWDPFYAVFYRLHQEYKDNAAINGRF